MAQSFFSVSHHMIDVEAPLTYDLYINSSALSSRERYVKIQSKGQTIGARDLKAAVDKYYRVYVCEDDRSAFLRSVVKSKGATIEQKTTILKDSAIDHLKTLFEEEAATPQVIGKTLVECREVVEGMIDVLEEQDIDRVRDLIANLSFHDFYTYDHSVNVSMYCILIYRLIDPEAPREMIILAGMGGLLHDLGKIRISTEILNKSDKLTDEEFAEIRKHPGTGFDLLTCSESKPHLPAGIDIGTIARVIYEHHENFDGTGYPNQISGEDIHILARVTAIADFFDAITTKRSYHEPLTPEDALAVMRKTEGKKLDPELLDVFAEGTASGAIHRMIRKELPPDFDPCQPHKTLPLEKSDPRSEERDKDFGKIRIVAAGNEAHASERDGVRSGRIQVIDPKKAAPTTPKKKRPA